MIWAVVLAAGASSRFGSPKQALLLEPVLDRVRASSVDDALVVLGAYELESSARTVRCRDWERGPGASLRCGLAALPAEAEAAVVVLGDGPGLDPAAIDRVVSAWGEQPAPVVAATYEGIRLHPVLRRTRGLAANSGRGRKGSRRRPRRLRRSIPSRRCRFRR